MRVSPSHDQIHRAFEQVQDNPAFAESARLFQSGKLPAEMIQAFALRPELLRAFAHLSDAVYPGGIVERDIKELIILESSRLNACQFCTNSHIAIARELGISDEPIAMLDDPASLNERQRLAISYTRAVMNDSNRVPIDLHDQLRAEFTDSEIVEITFVIGYINALNLFNNALQVTYRNDYESA